MKEISHTSALSAKSSFGNWFVFAFVFEHLLGIREGVRSWRDSVDEGKLVLMFTVTVCPNLGGAFCFPVVGVLATIQLVRLEPAPQLSSFIYPFNETSLKCLAGEAELKDMSLPAGNSLQ